ncbi:2-iminobutanoate/2-iminopropanoate deaminase-like [Nothobranchius furzeri]|uniref:2-iminobutanoate/2-iminopropanoate deaminase-like n=1 Tax=Nothobranchius furzeri TaxID=105023 RepID=UPI003904DF42
MGILDQGTTSLSLVSPFTWDQFVSFGQAVVVDRSVYVSGQLGMDPVSGQLVGGGVQAQTRQALVNMGEILRMAGCTYENVVKTTVLLADINDFSNVNEVYKQCEYVGFPSIDKSCCTTLTAACQHKLAIPQVPFI